MLLFVNLMDIHWYFQFVAKVANHRYILSKYITFKEMLPIIVKALIVLHDI